MFGYPLLRVALTTSTVVKYQSETGNNLRFGTYKIHIRYGVLTGLRVSTVVLWIVILYRFVGGYQPFGRSEIPSTIKMVAKRSSETSVTYKTKQCHGPEDHNRRVKYMYTELFQ